MNGIELFTRIAARFPETDPEISEVFPSGSVMLDITIRVVRYCVEYLPSRKVYGLSKIEGAMPFFEGFEQSFTSAEQLESKILEMINSTK